MAEYVFSLTWVWLVGVLCDENSMEVFPTHSKMQMLRSSNFCAKKETNQSCYIYIGKSLGQEEPVHITYYLVFQLNTQTTVSKGLHLTAS